MTDELTVVYVDDRASWRSLVREAFAELDREVRVEAFGDVPAAVEFLADAGGQSASERLVLLVDLYLGDRSGLELLDALRDRGDLPSPPAIVFSTSDDERDVAAAYAHGANGYVEKPSDFDRLVEFVRCLTEYVRFPRTSVPIAA